jgi:hypothetical protein
MNKIDKFVVAFCSVFLMGIIVVGCAVRGCLKDQGTNYSATMIVSEVSTTFDMVEISTSTNIHYVFEGAEDWAVGDFVAVTMNDNGTPDDVTDDIIINCTFAGTMENFDFVLLEKIER